MSPIIIFILGIIVGFAISSFIKNKSTKIDSIMQVRTNAKKKRKEKIVEYLRKNESITNNGVEELLNVSDTSAYNYLEELEQEKIIQQYGKTGRSVEYRLNQ